MNRIHHAVFALLTFALLIDSSAAAAGRAVTSGLSQMAGSSPYYGGMNRFQQAHFTLTGTLDLALVKIESAPSGAVPSMAIVQCWICEGEGGPAYCDSTYPVGPAEFRVDVLQQAMSQDPIQGLPWEVQFDLTDSGYEPADFGSYYCRLGFRLVDLPNLVDITGNYAGMYSHGFVTPLGPGYTGTDPGMRALTAAEGSQMVEELWGTIGS